MILLAAEDPKSPVLQEVIKKAALQPLITQYFEHMIKAFRIP